MITYLYISLRIGNQIVMYTWTSNNKMCLCGVITNREEITNVYAISGTYNCSPSPPTSLESTGCLQTNCYLPGYDLLKTNTGIY